MSDQSEVYAAQLVESLSDVVDTMNEALADGIIFNFSIEQRPGADGKPHFVLAALNATKQIDLTHDAKPVAN